MTEEMWDDYPEWAWDKPSKAVIVNGTSGGCVLYTAGPYLRMEIHEAGIHDIEDLGLDDAPIGISIWEGSLTYDGNGEPVAANGTFREPTEQEWMAIRAHQCPWDDNAWRVKES